MKVVFFGSSRYIVPTIEMLHNNFNLALVVTTEQNSMDPVPFYCKAKKINFISIRKSADLISNYDITSTLAEVGIVADFGLILPQQLFKVFPFGLINIHPSLLPKYRGPSPVQNSILNGDTQTGVTIIELDKNVDHGPVVAQVEEEIKQNDTAKSLYERLFKVGANLLLKELTRIESGKLLSIPQNHEHATFTHMLTRDDGYVDIKNFFSNKEFFDRMVRAYYPWPGAWTKIKVNPNEKIEKVVKFLPEKRIQVEGGKEMGYKDFINGYPNANSILIDFLKKEL